MKEARGIVDPFRGIKLESLCQIGQHVSCKSIADHAALYSDSDVATALKATLPDCNT